jgi:hypothetical protein
MARKQGLIFRWLQAGRAPAAYSISHGDLFEFGNIDEKGRLGVPFMILKFFARKTGWGPWQRTSWEVEVILIPGVPNPSDWISHLCSTIEKKGDDQQ